MHRPRCSMKLPKMRRSTRPNLRSRSTLIWAMVQSAGPAHDLLGVDLGLVEVHSQPGCFGYTHDSALRPQRRLQEELVDLVPLDQVLQQRTQVRWLRRDEVRRRGRRMAV